MYVTVRRGSNRGAALMIALGILAIMGMLGGAFVLFMRIEQTRADYEMDVMRARYLARAAIEVARVNIGSDPAGSPGEITGELGDGTYKVAISPADGEYEADATGMYTRVDGRQVTARIYTRMRPVGGAVRVGMWQE